jgi:hypothetical protein
MGMFDTIYCRQPLPDGLGAEDFQTKSLHSTLSVYEIGADGRLRELAVDSNGNLLSEDMRDTGYHGVLRFHTCVGTELKVYEAKFSDGLLVGLRTEDDALYDERGLRRIMEDPK